MSTVILLVAIGLAVVFDVTNGFHDSANSVAALVATRAATPGQALVLATVGNFAGPLLMGTAVADTVGGVVTVAPNETLPAVGAALTAAIGWNLVTWWFGLPSSSSHALIGGLIGAAVAAGGFVGVRWGGIDHGKPDGVLGVLAGLAISPVLGVLAGALGMAVAGRALRRARREFNSVVRRGEWLTASALALSHGANDAQKTMGVITLLLLATGHLSVFSVPIWVRLMAAASLTVGTAFGGWRIVRTVGSGVYRIAPLDGLVSQGGSAAVILAGAALGAPVSTTHVVASSVVGVGIAQRAQHVRWTVVREIGAAWMITLPISALLGAAAFLLWREFI
ncbi:inorganic phosphate transporter [Mycolicibacterium pallens]|uniref:Inorganic phosphate transporter n=1 Tax=Mycolicibacterium pallens TaxID=370524 RepID=A0ABX8VHH0_9MYCO|nr:inorganic phosphate transporter [Mycolicibacterium pallens]QYL15421.1 inorganic phosphate transporter [Mycolicibacterium pallens]